MIQAIISTLLLLLTARSSQVFTSDSDLKSVFLLQLLELLNVKNEEGTRNFLRILGTTLDLLHNSHPEAISVHIFTPLFSFLSLSDVDISNDIERLHRLFVAGTSVELGSEFVIQGLGPHIWSLICIHAQSGVSYLKNILEDILLRYFGSETEQRQKEIFEGILGIQDTDLSDVNVNIHVKPSSGGGLLIFSQPPPGWCDFSHFHSPLFSTSFQRKSKQFLVLSFSLLFYLIYFYYSFYYFI